MNGPPRKEWWAKRQRGYGDGRHTDRVKTTLPAWKAMRDYAIYDELSSFRKTTVFEQALKDMVLAGSVEAKALWRLQYVARDNLFHHAQHSKQRTPFIDELLARALALRMGAGDGQAAE